MADPYAAPTPPPVSDARPVTVTAAAGAMVLNAVLGLIAAAMLVAVLGKLVDLIVASTPNMPAGSDGIVKATTAVGVVIGLIGAVIWLVLAMLVLRGKNVARIIAWVWAGLGVICGGWGLISSPQQQSQLSGKPGYDDIAWYFSTSMVLGIVQLLLVIAVIVLLALPASNQWFALKKAGPQQEWQPPAA